MRVFTTQVTGCGTCPYVSNQPYYGDTCQHETTLDLGLNKCQWLYYENVASITESCPMYSQTVELPC